MTRGYDPLTKLLHWLVFVLVAAQYAVGEFMPHIGRKALDEGLIAWHFSLGAAVLAAIGCWRVQPLKWKRALSAAGAALVVVLVFLARVNIYELMFHPDVHPSFSAARDVKLDGAEKVVAVRIGGEARAYPIRGMSYHHVVNDVVGGVAIVATY